MARVLFAFSGGIDDVLSIHWLRQMRGYQVIALLADIGQGSYLEPLGELALESGAEGTLIVDLRQRFVEEYIFPTLASGAHYEDYLLATPLARYVICEELVHRAQELGIEILGHGSSSHGNDQIRFESSVSALNPNLRVLAALRDRKYTSLEEKREDIRRYRLPNPPEFQRDVSFDRNLWGCGGVHGSLADPWEAPDPRLYQMTQDPRDTPDTPGEIILGFRSGIPSSIDGEDLDPISLVETLTRRGGEHGVGRLDHVENRMVGGKTREIYEAPCATILYSAHAALEEITQTRSLNRYKRIVSEEYGRLVYEGLWFSELREALDSFFRTTQRFVTGRIRLRLFKGKATVSGRESKFSLYDSQLDSPEGQARFRDLVQGYVDIVTMPSRSEAGHRRRPEDAPRSDPSRRRSH